MITSTREYHNALAECRKIAMKDRASDSDKARLQELNTSISKWENRHATGARRR